MPRTGYDDVVLLTGFPSFAARRMCEELVRGPERAFVHVLVPPDAVGPTEAWLDILPIEQRGRIHIVEGDPAAIDFGLSGAELKALMPEIDIIHHMAQVTDVGADRKALERANVEGAREVLEIASMCTSLRNLVYHSTARVSGDRTGLVLEEELDQGQTFRNPVEETIASGERIVRSRRAEIPVTIVRPTIIVGDSKSGEVERFDGPYVLVLLIVTSPPDFPLPLPGRGDTLLHLVPIDYVVRAAKAIGRDPRAPGRTFHIGDPSPLTARRVFELVAAAGGRKSPPGFLSANLTKALLKTPGLDRIAKSPRAFLEALASPVAYSFAGTSELLAETDIRCPPFESYVDGIVEFVQHRLREKRARARVSTEVEDPLG